MYPPPTRRYNTDDIFEMIYDAASGPERDLGVETRSFLTGNTTANYWPGAPALVADEPIEIHNYDYGRYIPNDNEAEEIIISKWTTERGLTITRKARAWSYPDYDDFIILEVIIENTGDNNGDGIPDAGLPVDHKDVYFAFVNNLAPSWGRAPLAKPNRTVGVFRSNHPGRLVQIQRSIQLRWLARTSREKNLLCL